MTTETVHVFQLFDPKSEPDADGRRVIQEVQLFGEITQEGAQEAADLAIEEIEQAIEERGWLVDGPRALMIVTEMMAYGYALGLAESEAAARPVGVVGS
jgi:hypothetical protein